MIRRINPFQFKAFGYYSQGEKIDFATARPASTMVEISNTVAEGCNVEIEVMAMIDNA